eukprot:5798445-Amphidinium_carterae.1
MKVTAHRASSARHKKTSQKDPTDSKPRFSVCAFLNHTNSPPTAHFGTLKRRHIRLPTFTPQGRATGKQTMLHTVCTPRSQLTPDVLRLRAADIWMM